MSEDDRKTLLAEIINTAQEAKNHVVPGPGKNALNRIIRLSKRLYLDAIKEKENPSALEG